MNVVIYARYSSHSQTEQSIEGQLQTCYEYAKANGHIIVSEYIDRAQSGTTDSRTEFQRMISDSDKQFFEAVFVYQLDRFARNRYDSAINKAKLKKNGIRVISAKENITDGKEEYLLTTKLFCGYCREMMTGYGGTSKTGRKYHYYACKNAKKGQCQKKIVNKKNLEDRVVLECRKLLTENNIERISKEVATACESDYDSSAVKRIKAAVQETNEAIENLWKALEHGQSVEMITERIEKRKMEKEDLQAQLAIEMSKQVIFTAPQIRSFLYSLKKGNINDENNRRGLVNIFLQAIYLKDDRFTLILNGGNKPIVIDDILLDEIETALEEGVECSSMVAGAPPFERRSQFEPSCPNWDRCFYK